MTIVRGGRRVYVIRWTAGIMSVIEVFLSSTCLASPGAHDLDEAAQRCTHSYRETRNTYLLTDKTSSMG
jgi:hypothetical protein